MTALETQVQIQWEFLRKLIPYKNNPKDHPPQQIEKIAQQIYEFGFDQPIVVDEDYVVLKGHGRLLAAKHLKLLKVPVIVKMSLSDAQKRAIRIGDNKVAESGWIDQYLKTELEVLAQQDFDLTLTGFDQDELDEWGIELSEAFEEEQRKEKRERENQEETSKPPTADLTPRCQHGEIWQLGRHLLLCGVNSLKRDAIAPLLTDHKPSLVWADPPYGIKCQDKHGSIGGGGKGYAAKEYLPVVGDDTTATALTSLELCQVLWPLATQVWWGSNHYGVPPSPGWIVWDKQNEGTQFADAELAWTNKQIPVRIFRHTWNGMHKEGEAAGEKRCHPNQKPVELASWVFENYGKPDDVIFDPFVGSGCSYLGAQRIDGNRIVLGCEILLEYCELTMQRFEQKFGIEPVRV